FLIVYSDSHLLRLDLFPTRRSSDLGGASPPWPGSPPPARTPARRSRRLARSCRRRSSRAGRHHARSSGGTRAPRRGRSGGCSAGDRKSTRLNSSHVKISYAVFCLKK